MSGKGRTRRKVNDFRCREFFADFDGGGIGVYPICPTFAIEPQRRDDRHDSLVKQQAQCLDIDTFNPARELVVRPSENSGRMGDDRR